MKKYFLYGKRDFPKDVFWSPTLLTIVFLLTLYNTYKSLPINGYKEFLFRYSSEIIVQTRLLAISQDCRQSCEIVKSCENRAVGVQISDFCLWWRHYSRRPNTSRKIVPRLFIERLFLYHCEIVARLLKKFHVWYALIARLFRDFCKIVARLSKIFICAMLCIF